jgi:ATP-dependent RNA helicase DDX31/DBP7
LARRSFRSHIRAYATHVREERGFFDITHLHLGHVAKSFALREAPGGIGGGVSRRTGKASSRSRLEGEAAQGGSHGTGKRSRPDADDELEIGKGTRIGADENASRRMREKMKAMDSTGISEFHIA